MAIVKFGGNFCFSTINSPPETLIAAASDTLAVPSNAFTVSEGFGVEISAKSSLFTYSTVIFVMQLKQKEIMFLQNTVF